MTPAFSCHLENRGIIHLGGADRRSFLQGLISNDINMVTSERAIYAGLLTPQGKFLFDLFIIEDGETFLIDCEAVRAEDLIKRLTAYKLRAKVTLADARGEFDVWAMSPEPSRRKPGSSDPIGQSLPDDPLGPGFRRGGACFYSDPRLPELGMRVIMKKETVPADVKRTDLAAYDSHRLALGVADGSRDLLIEKSTLVEGNFDFLNGISWSKGCYVGQELTARMHYRGLAKKRLHPVTIEGAAPVSGTIVKFGDEDSGDMRSHAGNLGLALLNIEKADQAMRENALLICGESKLKVLRPAWMDLSKEKT